MALNPAGPADEAAARIGIFGGAFDPPHNAHAALALAAITQLKLDELRIFPTGQAWHKAHGLSAAEHRLAMARLAFEALPGAVVDDREIRRSGPTYTLDTLREMRLQRPDAELMLLLGADQARALPTWHGWQEILALAIVCVAQRPDPAGRSAAFDPDSLTGRPSGARFWTIELPAMEISATDIRARAARGEDLSSLVPPAVARYIDLHHLYANT
ncbi:nicotinate (nicotinamide) nucleotide adenylyltransferase [Variovorax dokdonensis]|uniref:Probable nicotinate-nucleotide adenylyltransferase n=1 Tax=Variovorax dokdonensis TaxID=344883 RepID=A0ABT7N8W6_9BURK|nr:nicotinate (nicotinamide) nucleotide adenylyltransferase [Variovorax dokdonensis]MDM0044378.1 nicotinate (nicotinamide) nucleotide adenylyltransferase [Variovorax dokdonensis]